MRTCDDLQKDINSTMNALIEKMDQRAKCLAPSPTSPGEVLYPFDDPTESGSRSDEGASPSGDGCSDIQSEIDALWEKLEGLMNDLESDNCVNVKPDPGEWQGPAMYA